MTAAAIDDTARRASTRRARTSGTSSREWWGRLFVAPYVLIFLGFVVFPVGYAFWLARKPALYVELVDDPIFIRTAVNTLVFLVVAINLKMMLALFLSGF